MEHKSIKLMIAMSATILWQSSQATEVNLSGFGTMGYAQSNQSFNYQRFINDKGTLKRDSLFGLQTDITFNQNWGITWQGVVAPADNNENRVELRSRWAFLSYRPSNDWLLRAGKLRVGSFLNMQNMEVGTTYNMARLPAEVYSVAPLYDFTGASIGKTWHTGDWEINLEGMWGKTDSNWRQYLNGRQQAVFVSTDLEVKGLMLTLNQDEDAYRLGFYSTTPKLRGNGFFVGKFNVIPNDPHIPGNTLTGMGGDLLVSSNVTETTSNVITLSASKAFGSGYRVIAEYARRVVDQIDTGPDSHAYYVNLSKTIGKWIPYIGYARMWSDDSEMRQWRQVRSARVPTTGGLMPAIDQTVAAGYQDAASGIFVYDQASVMLGTSYSISATQKLKMEVMQTHVGETSSMVDANVSNKDIMVYSLSYSFAF